jgi:hypothetical protein
VGSLKDVGVLTASRSALAELLAYPPNLCLQGEDVPRRLPGVRRQFLPRGRQGGGWRRNRPRSAHSAPPRTPARRARRPRRADSLAPPDGLARVRGDAATWLTSASSFPATLGPPSNALGNPNL